MVTQRFEGIPTLLVIWDMHFIDSAFGLASQLGKLTLILRAI
jgi:hypothetical protein